MIGKCLHWLSSGIRMIGFLYGCSCLRRHRKKESLSAWLAFCYRGKGVPTVAPGGTVSPGILEASYGLILPSRSISAASSLARSSLSLTTSRPEDKSGYTVEPVPG